MGEITDMILDGTLCQECGVYMGDPVGYPVTCGACNSDTADPSVDKTACPFCGKRKRNVQAHIDAVHPEGE